MKNIKKQQKDFPEYVGGFYNNLHQKHKKKYQTYSDWKWFRSPASRAYYNQTKKTIIKAIGNKHYLYALEIGPGDGVWTELFLQNCSKIDAIDISSEMLKMAKQKLKGKNVNFMQGNFLKQKFRQKYALIFSIRCLEYIPKKEKAISKFSKLLKDGGELIIITKNPYFIKFRSRDKLLHSKQIKIEKLLEILRKNNFEIISVFPALFGKGMHFFLFREIFSLFHEKLLQKKIDASNFLIKYLSESFLIKCRKIK